MFTHDRVEEVHCGGLAVRSRHSDDLERIGRVAVERGGDGCHRDARVRDHDLRHTDGKRTLVEQRDRAALDRFGSEVVSVDEEPAHAHEQRAGCDRSASRTRPR